MAEIQPPAYEAGQCYTPEQDRSLWASIICSEGVVDRAGGDLLVTSAGGMSVSVAAGDAWISGDTVEGQGYYFVRNDGPVTRTHDASDPVDDRIDLIVARVYDAQYAGTESRWALEIVKGVPSPAPVPPTAPDNTIILAQVRVRAAAVSVLPSDITDTRTQFQLCSGSQPPQGITGIVKFESSGTFSKASYPNLRAVIVKVVGAGGGGGGAGATAAAQGTAGGGGGGGAYAERYLLASQLPASVVVTVGTGGAGSPAGSGANGSTGAQSTFGGMCTAGGGVGGQWATAANTSTFSGGAGGMPFSSDYGMAGQHGDHGRTVAAEPNPARGGNSGHGFGAGAVTANALSAGGNAGSLYGGGGSGGQNRASVGASVGGGNGADGVIIVTLIH